MSAPGGEAAPIIIQVIIDTRALEQQTAAAGQRAGERAGEGFKDKFQKAAKIAGAAAGLAIAGGLAGALNVQDANNKLTKQLGLTAEASARVGKVSGELYANAYGDSIDDVNNAIKSVVQNIDGMGTASAADLENVSKGVLNLSSTFGQDLEGTTRAVSQMLRTGLAKNADEALDILAAGFQNGADKSGDLLDTFNEYGTQFRKLGIDGVTATGLLSQGLKAGARDSDLVADALKEFSIRAADGSATSAAGFKAIGLNAKEMTAVFAKGGPDATKALDDVLGRLKAIKDPAARSAAAVSLFGTQAEDLGDALFALDPSAAAKGLGDISKAAESLDVMSTADQFKQFKRSVEAALQDAVVAAMPVLKGLGDFLSATLVPIVRSLGEFLGRHATAVKVVAVAVLALWAAYKGYKIIMAVNAAMQALTVTSLRLRVMMLRSIIQTKLIAAANKVWAATQAVLNAVMSANPLALVVIAIVALVAVIVLAYKKSETFREIVQKVWETVKNAIGSAVEFIVRVVKAAWAAIQSATEMVFNAIKAYFQLWWNVISTVFTTAVNVIKAVLSTVWNVIKTTITGIWDGIKLYFTTLWNVISAIFTTAVNTIKTVLSTAWNAIKSAVTSAFDGIKAVITNVWDGIKNVISNAIEGVKRLMSGAWDGIKGAVTAAWDGISGAVSSGFKKITDFLGTAKSKIGAVASGLFDGLKDAALAPFRAIASLWNNSLGKISFHIPSWVPGIGGNGFSFPTIPEFARGGWATGPGTSVSDSFMAALSRGEYVVNAQQARDNRPAMEALDNGKPVIPAEWANRGGSGATINNNYYGPTVGSDRRREIEWTLRYAPQ